MDVVQSLFAAFELIFQPGVLLYICLGVVMGIALGILPGLGGIAGMSILIVVLTQFQAEPLAGIAIAIGMIAVIPTSDTFASVLLGIPGSSASQATVLDGFPLAKQGKAAQALSSAFVSSLFGGILGTAYNRDLNILTVKNPNCLSTINPAEEWIELEVTVDSGACDTVMPQELCRGIPIVDSAGPRAGLEYKVANGDGLPNLGERRCLLMTLGSSTAKRIVFQVADVHKPLLSISRCADMGFTCVLGKLGGYLQDEMTGERIPLQRRENLYVLRTWVRADTGQVNRDQPFPRPA